MYALSHHDTVRISQTENKNTIEEIFAKIFGNFSLHKLYCLF